MSRKKREAKRWIKINGVDRKLQISRVAALNTTKQFIHLDELKDGSWRLCYTSNTIKDFTKVNSFDIIRED